MVNLLRWKRPVLPAERGRPNFAHRFQYSTIGGNIPANVNLSFAGRHDSFVAMMPSIYDRLRFAFGGFSPEAARRPARCDRSTCNAVGLNGTDDLVVVPDGDMEFNVEGQVHHPKVGKELSCRPLSAPLLYP